MLDLLKKDFLITKKMSMMVGAVSYTHLTLPTTERV